MKTITDVKIKTNPLDGTVCVTFESVTGEQQAMYLLNSLQQLKEALDTTQELRLEQLGWQ